MHKLDLGIHHKYYFSVKRQPQDFKEADGYFQFFKNLRELIINGDTHKAWPGIYTLKFLS